MKKQNIDSEEYLDLACQIETDESIHHLQNKFFELIDHPYDPSKDFIKNIAPLQEEILSKKFKDSLMETKFWSKKKPYGLITTIVEHKITIGRVDKDDIICHAILESSKLPFENIINRTRAAALLRALCYAK